MTIITMMMMMAQLALFWKIEKAKVDLAWRLVHILLNHGYDDDDDDDDDDDEDDADDDDDAAADDDDDDAAGPGASVSWSGLAGPIYQGVDPP